MNAHFLNKRLAYFLGIAGLIPFVVLMLGCLLVHPAWLNDFITGQRAYGIAILSFLGGVHWGSAMMANTLSLSQTRKAMLWGITPPLIAWFSTMAGGFSFAVLMAGFITAYLVDRRLYAWYQMPTWFIGLRMVLTAVVVLLLAFTVIIANARG